MTRGIIYEHMQSFRTQFDHHGEHRCHIQHIDPIYPHTQGGGQMVNMPCLLTAMVDFTSETCLVVVSILPYDDVTSFRSEIDHGGQ